MPQENKKDDGTVDFVPEESTRVDNFSIDCHAAIAGTTLKGMLSTLAEMASGSAMRVLNNRALSLRSTMGQSRSALGMIIGNRGNRKLLPLCLPTFLRTHDDPLYKPTYRRTDAQNEIWHELLSRRRAIDEHATMTAVYVQKQPPEGFCFHEGRKIVALPGAYPGINWHETNKRPDASQHELVRKGSLLRL